MQSNTKKVVALREEPNIGESPQAVADKIAVLRRQRSLSTALLEDLKADLDTNLINGGDAGSLMTRLAMEERKVEAFSREIARLERKAFPEAVAEEAENARRAALAEAKALHEDRLENAREIVRLGAKIDARWKAFRDSEAEYQDAIYRAELAPRETSNAGIVCAISAVIPSMIADLSTVFNSPVLDGDDPVALVKAAGPDRLRRQR